MSTTLELPTLGSLREEQRGLEAQLARLRRRMSARAGAGVRSRDGGRPGGNGGRAGVPRLALRLERSTRLARAGRESRGIRRRLGRAVRGGAGGHCRLDDLSLAIVLDRFRPGTGQRVADVLQLPELLTEETPSASPAMVRLAVQQASAALAESDWRSLWNKRRTAVHAGAYCWACSSRRRSRPGAGGGAVESRAGCSAPPERWPQRTYLAVMGLDQNGRLLAPRDEPLALEVRADLPLIEKSGDLWILQGRDEPLAVPRKPARPVAPDSVQIRERTADGTRREGTMAAIAPMRSSTSCRLRERHRPSN